MSPQRTVDFTQRLRILDFFLGLPPGGETYPLDLSRRLKIVYGQVRIMLEEFVQEGLLTGNWEEEDNVASQVRPPRLGPQRYFYRLSPDHTKEDIVHRIDKYLYSAWELVAKESAEIDSEGISRGEIDSTQMFSILYTFLRLPSEGETFPRWLSISLKIKDRLVSDILEKLKEDELLTSREEPKEDATREGRPQRHLYQLVDRAEAVRQIGEYLRRNFPNYLKFVTRSEISTARSTDPHGGPTKVQDDEPILEM
jgi:transcription initiation factor IIE alpha subunit